MSTAERERAHRLARQAVMEAVALGALTPAGAQACVDCGQRAVEHHHHRGYDREHWLDVVPVCNRCHDERHRFRVHLRALAALRTAAGLSRARLAQLSGLSSGSTIARLESGPVTARPRTVAALAEVLGVEPADLYGEAEAPRV